MTRQAEVSGPDSGFNTIATGPSVCSEFGRFGRLDRSVIDGAVWVTGAITLGLS